MGHVRGFTRRGTFPSRQRRKTTWETGPGGTDALPITASTASLVGAGLTFLVDGTTVARIRGELMIMQSQATASLDGMRGAFGIGLASLPAFNAGIGSLPTPLTEQDDDNWLYWTAFAVVAHISTEADFMSDSVVFRKEVDTGATWASFPGGLTPL